MPGRVRWLAPRVGTPFPESVKKSTCRTSRATPHPDPLPEGGPEGEGERSASLVSASSSLSGRYTCKLRRSIALSRRERVGVRGCRQHPLVRFLHTPLTASFEGRGASTKAFVDNTNYFVDDGCRRKETRHEDSHH